MLEICRRHDEGSLRLDHLLAADCEEAMDVHPVRQAEAGRLEHAWPKERVKVCNVFADEMVNLRLRRLPPIFELLASSLAPSPRAGDVAERGVEPDIPIVARRIGNFEAKVRGG